MRNAVVTTRKINFLRREFNMMNFSNFKEFREVMECDAIQCKKCGTWYWRGCKMRCECLNEKTLAK